MQHGRESRPFRADAKENGGVTGTPPSYLEGRYERYFSAGTLTRLN